MRDEAGPQGVHLLVASVHCRFQLRHALLQLGDEGLQLTRVSFGPGGPVFGHRRIIPRPIQLAPEVTHRDLERRVHVDRIRAHAREIRLTLMVLAEEPQRFFQLGL